MPGELIGEWDTSKLTKFVEQHLREDPPTFLQNQTLEQLIVTRLLTIQDELMFSLGQTTVGAAGSASAPPANPTQWLRVLLPSGAVAVVPAYNP